MEDQVDKTGEGESGTARYKIKRRSARFSEKSKSALEAVLSKLPEGCQLEQTMAYPCLIGIKLDPSAAGECMSAFGFMPVRRCKKKKLVRTSRLWWKKALLVDDEEFSGAVFWRLEDTGTEIFTDMGTGTSLLIFKLEVASDTEGYGVYIRPCGCAIGGAPVSIRSSSRASSIASFLTEHWKCELPLDKNLLPYRKIQWGREIMVVLPEELEQISKQGYVDLE